MAPKRRKTQIGGGESSNPPPPQKEIQVTIDPDLMDCSICFQPLCSPVNQCDNGHVACHACWSKLKYKCHICNVPVVTRNIALEKVLESIHLPCTYTNLGCRKSVSYSQMQVHTDTCEFGPSLCPISGCAHKAFSGEWRGHFLKDHCKQSSEHSYRLLPRTISINKDDPYFTLFGPDKDLFLLVNELIPNVGNGISLFYVDLPYLDQRIFSYQLEVVSRENNISRSLQLWNRSEVVSIKEWKRGEVHGSSLVVPSRFLLSRSMTVMISIYKPGLTSSDSPD